jgi:hypothetical protein
MVSAVNDGVEGANSAKVSVTPVAMENAILNITLDNGSIKEYNLSGNELNDFLVWYDNRSEGIGRAYYKFIIKNNITPFKQIVNYIPYNKILFYDIKTY